MYSPAQVYRIRIFKQMPTFFAPVQLLLLRLHSLLLLVFFIDIIMYISLFILYVAVSNKEEQFQELQQKNRTLHIMWMMNCMFPCLCDVD